MLFNGCQYTQLFDITLHFSVSQKTRTLICTYIHYNERAVNIIRRNAATAMLAACQTVSVDKITPTRENNMAMSDKTDVTSTLGKDIKSCRRCLERYCHTYSEAVIYSSSWPRYIGFTKLCFSRHCQNKINLVLTASESKKIQAARICYCSDIGKFNKCS